MENVVLISKNLDKFPEGLSIALKQMCSIIGVSEINLDLPFWFHEHTWTSEQENEFKSWLYNTLKTDKSMVKSLTKNTNLGKTKEAREKLVNEFVFNYGWKVNE